ncbi:MAG: hypothetical protein NC132_00740 [Corallococcus sp.]|nr:hypothetical protein [Corallococcus sp.]MCM1359243.1 hypothetical protein [Corallococcus sp.]MCM1394634.1 hypothetical protein [Corallococcus sp.]
MKATFRNTAFVLVILAAVLSVLAVTDRNNAEIKTAKTDTCVRLNVTDLDGNPVHNAKVTVCGETFFTDNKGLSPSIQILDPQNAFDNNVTDWHTVDVIIKKDGYVPTIMFNCVVYDKQTRKISVKIYPLDASDLPYVCYVESPPDDFVKDMIK